MKKRFRFLSILVFVSILVSSAFSVSAEDTKDTQLKDGQAITLQIEDLMNVTNPFNLEWTIYNPKADNCIISRTASQFFFTKVLHSNWNGKMYSPSEVRFGNGQNGDFLVWGYDDIVSESWADSIAKMSAQKSPSTYISIGKFNFQSVKALGNGRIAVINTPGNIVEFFDSNGQKSNFDLGISWGEPLNPDESASLVYPFFAVDINYSIETGQYTLIYGNSAYVRDAKGNQIGNKNCRLGVMIFDSIGKKINSFKLNELYREQFREYSYPPDGTYGGIDWQVTFRDSFYGAENANIFYVSGLKTKTDMETYKYYKSRPTRYHAINLETGTYEEIAKSEFNAKKNEPYDFPIEFKCQKEGTYIFDKTNPSTKPLFFEGIYLPVAYSFFEDGSVKVIISKSTSTQLTDTISVPESWLK